MRIFHIADLHLGAANYKLNSVEKKTCKDEQLLLVRRFFEIANNEKVDIILIAGDLFHSQHVSSRIQKSFFDCVKTFTGKVFYVQGNHDESMIDDPPANFYCFDEILKTYTLENVTISGQTGNIFELQPLPADHFNFVLQHGDIFTLGNDYIDIKPLQRKNIDYLALGHLHQFQNGRLDERGRYVYSGCMFANGFDECGNKGYVDITVTDKIQCKFVPFAVRKYQVITVDITGQEKFADIQDRIAEALQHISSKDLVRVILTGETSEDCEKYLSVLQQHFDKSFFYFEILDETKVCIDFEKYRGETFSLKAELLKLIDASMENDADKNKLSRIAMEALRGDEISL